MWTYIHTRLQTACIYLWPIPADCRALVAEAEMDSSRMTFDEPPALRWESVILQGEKQRSLNKLAPVLLARYPNNPDLQLAVSPWIHGNPSSAVEPAVKDKPEPVVKAKAETTTVVTETPTTVTTTTQVQKVPGTNVEVEFVPVVVPKEFAEDASVALVATISSLRSSIAQHEKDIQELVAWRFAISTLSRAEVAERTGANEPGENRVDTIPTETGASTIDPKK